MPLPESLSVPLVVVGAGVIGKKHAQAISDFPNAAMVAVVDPTSAGRDLAEQFECDHFESVASLLSSQLRVEGAIICTPNDTHVSVATQFASAGINLLVEKPLSHTVLDGMSLLDHCTQKNINICVGHHRRQNPRILAAKAALDRSSIGQVLGCSGVWATLKPAAYFTGAGIWRAGSTGGVVLINVIHEIDLLQFLIGRIVRVYAEKAPSTRGHEAEEGVAMTFKFGNGAVGTFIALDSSSSPFTFEQATGEFAYHHYTGQECYKIFGSRGTLSVPTNQLWVPENLEEGWYSQLRTENIDCTNSEAFIGQLANFVNVIRRSASPSCSGEDGLSAVAVCEAIYASLRTQMPVDIPQITWKRELTSAL